MRNTEIKNEIINVFQTSNSPDDLFDNFRIAIDRKVKDLDLYIALLWNKALSKDEVLMFVEKIYREFPEFGCSVYLTAAKILDSSSLYGTNKELAFGYIKKAAAADKTSVEPYNIVSEIYNKELNIPPFKNIISFLESGIDLVEDKSRLYFILAKLYGKIGDIEKGRKYQKRGEEYQKGGR